MFEHDARIERLFHEAADLNPEECQSFLTRECGDDTELRSAVEQLLRQDADDDDFRLENANAATALRGAALDAVPTEQPARVGGFRIIGRLGEGGMGTVYEAEQDDPRRPVALKMIRPGLLSPARMKRLRHEARILERLQHPGIARIYEAGISDGQPFFAMELVRGIPFDEYVRRENPSTRDRLSIFALVCDAVQHAHERNIVHRDLKPGNILVADDGKPSVVDFGIARSSSDEMQLTGTLTRTGQLLGTLNYMSPEQVSERSTELDQRSDIYTLGVVLFEILTGRMPYDVVQTSLAEVGRVIRYEDAPQLGSIDTAFRGDVETIVGKALEKDKSRRYQSAAEFAGDIRCHLDNRPITARPLSGFQRMRKFAARNRALVGTTAGLAVIGMIALVALSFVVTLQNRTNRDLAASNERQRARFNLSLNAIKEMTQTVMDDERLKQPQFVTLGTRLLQSTAEYCRNLERDLAGSNDAHSQRALAEAYFQLGEIAERVGSRKDALDNHQRALAINESLAQSGNVDSLMAVANSLIAVADQQSKLESPERTLATLDRGRDLLTNSIDWANRAEDAREALSSVYLASAEEHARLGRLEEADQNYQQAIDLLRASSGEEPDRLELAQLFASRGFLHSRIGVPDVAMKYQRQAESLLSEDESDEQGDGSRLDQLYSIYCGISSVLNQSRQIEESLKAIERARSILDKLHDQHPERGTGVYLRELAWIKATTGFRLLLLDRVSEARKSFEESVKTYESLCQSYPDEDALSANLAWAGNGLGEALVRSGRPNDGLVAYERSRDVLRRLAKENPTVSKHRQHLIACYGYIGSITRSNGDIEGARAIHEAALQIAEDGLDEPPAVADNFRGHKAAIQSSIGWTYRDQGDFAEAAIRFECSRQCAQQLVDTYPGVVYYHERLSTSLKDLAAIDEHYGRYEAAAMKRRRAEEVLGQASTVD